METNLAESLTYYDAEGPSVAALKQAYDKTVSDLSFYFAQCREAYDHRRNYWPGKSSDLRKHGADAFPWDGASDQEAHLINERIGTYVALYLSALNRANIRAYPVEAGDLGRAKVISAFLKWMVSTYIPGFKDQMELGGNHLQEKALMVTYVGWQKQQRRYLQEFNIEQIQQNSPELAAAIMGAEADEVLLDLIKAAFPDVKEKRAKKAIKELREKGKSTLPVSRLEVNRPHIEALSPDSDVFWPSYCTDPQRAPYVFWRTYLTAQEIESKVVAEGWNDEWAQHIINHFRGTTSGNVQQQPNNRGGSRAPRIQADESDLFEIVYCYQRLIDREDGAEGIYCTVMHPQFSGDEAKKIPGYGKFELLNGYEEYPFVVTRLSNDTKRMYDLQTIPEMLRGFQQGVKAERDARVDRNSIATVPETYGPPGMPAPERGPGRHNFEARPNSYRWGDQIPFNQGSVEVEQTLIKQADAIVGLDAENPLSSTRQQFYIEKFLSHVQDVLKLAYKCFQRFGPEEVYFRVTGAPDPMRFGRGDPDEDFDIRISFDVLNNDPETMDRKIQLIQGVMPADVNRRINPDAFIEAALNSIDPVLADAVLLPAEQAQAQMVKEVTDDLTKIYAGIELGARPNGAQIAAGVINDYIQQPDVAARLASDEGFKARLDKYYSQYVFQQQQVQNAQIGRIGTAPAQFQGANQ